MILLSKNTLFKRNRKQLTEVLVNQHSIIKKIRKESFLIDNPLTLRFRKTTGNAQSATSIFQ